MSTTIDIDAEGKPIGTTETTTPITTGNDMFRAPIQFNAATTFQSPFFWIVVGVGICAVGYWFIRRRSD